MFHRRDSRPKQHPPILTAMYEADLVRRSRHQRRASNRLSRAGTSSILTTTPTNNEIEKKTLHAKGDSTTTMTTTKTSRRRQTKHQITTYCLPSWGSAQPTPLHAVHVVPHFLPSALCDLMVLESQSKQFTKARHKHFPTVDIPLRQMTQSYHQFYPLLQSTVYPYIRELYRLPHGKFSIVDLFVVKYSSRGQDELKEHRDGSILSFNILLNKASEFRGGGTKFSGIQSGLTVRNEKGGCIFHCGKLKHSGVKIIGRESLRFILVGFLNVQSATLVDDASRLSLRSLTSDDEYLRGLYKKQKQGQVTSLKLANADKKEASSRYVSTTSTRPATPTPSATRSMTAAARLGRSRTTTAATSKNNGNSASSGFLSCFRPQRKKFPQTLPKCRN